MSQEALTKAASQARPSEGAGAPQAKAGSVTAPEQRLAALAGVKAEVTVVAGCAQTTVGEILGLKEGAVLTMDTPLNAPYDIVLNGAIIARGDLVAVGDNFGIRITRVQAAGV